MDKVSKRLGEEAYPYAYVAWDAFQCAAEALMRGDWKSTADPFAGNLVTVANSYIGLNGFLSLDANGDQANGHYAFYKLVSSGAGYAWNRQATYHFHPAGANQTYTEWLSNP